MPAGDLPVLAGLVLAKEAGLTKGSAYWHFSNKDALLEAAAAKALEAWMTEMLTPVLGIASAEKRVTAVIQSHIAHIQSPRSPAVFLAKLIAASSIGAQWAKRWRARVGELIGLSAKSVGAAPAADLLFPSLLGMTLQWDATGDAAALRAAGSVAAASLSLYLTEIQEDTNTYGTVLF